MQNIDFLAVLTSRKLMQQSKPIVAYMAWLKMQQC